MPSLFFALVLLPLTSPLPAARPELKPNPQLARSLLDSAAELAASVSPEAHVMALMHIGANYKKLDEAKAVAFLRDAFSTTAALPESSSSGTRSLFQAEIIRKMAVVRPSEAADLLRSLTPPLQDPEPTAAAIDKVVESLLAKSGFDAAIEVVNLIPDSIEYPFRAANRIFEALPPNDSRRLIVFARAAAAFRNRPHGPFPEMVAAHWKDVPRNNAEDAVHDIVSRILDRKDENNFKGVVDDNGHVQLSTRKTIELATILTVLHQLDPKRAKDLQAAHPEIKPREIKESQAKSESKDAASGDKDDDAIGPSFSLFDTDDVAASMEKFLRSADQARRVLALAAKEPDKALAMAGEIDLPSVRAQVLGNIAITLAEQDAKASRAVLEKCLTLVDGLKLSGDRILPRIFVATALTELDEKEAAWKTFLAALHDVAQVASLDQDPQRPNKAFRDHWPSTQAARFVMHAAVKVFGEEAQTLLPSLNDTDLALFAKIEIGRAFLGEDSSLETISVVH